MEFNEQRRSFSGIEKKKKLTLKRKFHLNLIRKTGLLGKYVMSTEIVMVEPFDTTTIAKHEYLQVFRKRVYVHTFVNEYNGLESSRDRPISGFCILNIANYRSFIYALRTGHETTIHKKKKKKVNKNLAKRSLSEL